MPKGGYGSGEKSMKSGYSKNRKTGGSSYPTAGNYQEKYMSRVGKKYDSPKV